MKVTLKDNYIDNYAFIGDIVGSIEVDDLSIEDIEHFIEHSSAYCIIDGKVKLDSNRLKEIENEKENQVLRRKRGEECFHYVNRGNLWYENLTDKEKKELSEWYQAWLDVTDTKVIPERPSFIK